MTRKAAIIGGGVIGGGWAARFLLNGWNVSIFDPDPEAPRKVGEVLANARRALPSLSDVPMPPEGRLSFAGTMAEAVEGAEYVQESVSERIELKHKVYAQLQQASVTSQWQQQLDKTLKELREQSPTAGNWVQKFQLEQKGSSQILIQNYLKNQIMAFIIIAVLAFFLAS